MARPSLNVDASAVLIGAGVLVAVFMLYKAAKAAGALADSAAGVVKDAAQAWTDTAGGLGSWTFDVLNPGSPSNNANAPYTDADRAALDKLRRDQGITVPEGWKRTPVKGEGVEESNPYTYDTGGVFWGMP